LRELIACYPIVALNLVCVIGARLQEAQQRLRELATQRVERRIANALLRLAAKAGQQNHDGTAIDFPLSRKDLAEICGATLHTVSRTLTAWEKEGLLTTANQRLTLHKLPEVRRMADDAGG
jgi:CRP-like cAMP-binding protein